MFRFSIRDVLWLTALVAMGLGWMADSALQRTRATLSNDAAYAEYREKMRLRKILSEKLPGWEQ